MFALRRLPPTHAADVLRTRRSIRRYLERPVPRDVLENLLEAATCAPSAHNTQPWRFAVLTERAGKERLARGMGERLHADRTGDGDRTRGDCTRRRALLCPHHIRARYRRDLPDHRRSRCLSGCAAPRRRTPDGGAGCWHGDAKSAACRECRGPRRCGDVRTVVLSRYRTRGLADLPMAWEPQALVTIGYPGQRRSKPFRRRPLTDIVRYLDGAS